MNNLNNLNNQIFRDVENQPIKRLIKKKKKKLQTAGAGAGDDNPPRPRPRPQPVRLLQAIQKNRKDDFDFEKSIEEKKQKLKEEKQKLKEEKQKLNEWAEKIIGDSKGKEELISYKIQIDNYKIQIDNYKKKIEKLEKDVERYKKSYLEENQKLLDCTKKLLDPAVTTVDTKPQSLSDLKEQAFQIQKKLTEGTEAIYYDGQLERKYEEISKLIMNHPEYKEETWKEENKVINNTALSKIQRFIPNSETLENLTLEELRESIKEQLNKIKNKDGKEECKKDEVSIDIEETAIKLSKRIFKFPHFFMYLTYGPIRLGKVHGADLFNNIKSDVLSVLEARAIYAALHDVLDEKILKSNITKGEWVKTLENKVESKLNPKTHASLIEADKLYDDLESFCNSYCAKGLFEVENKKKTYQRPVIGSKDPVQDRMKELEILGKKRFQKLREDAARRCKWGNCKSPQIDGADTQSGGKKLSNKMFYIIQDI